MEIIHDQTRHIKYKLLGDLYSKLTPSCNSSIKWILHTSMIQYSGFIRAKNSFINVKDSLWNS